MFLKGQIRETSETCQENFFARNNRGGLLWCKIHRGDSFGHPSVIYVYAGLDLTERGLFDQWRIPLLLNTSLQISVMRNSLKKIVSTFTLHKKKHSLHNSCLHIIF